MAEKFDRGITNTDKHDAYDVHNLYFNWRPEQYGLKGVSINFGVDNMFDENYSREDTALIEPGRNLRPLCHTT